MKPNITFGKCLNELLLARGWSAAQLSREISTDSSYIRRWIRGERVPALKTEFTDEIAYSLSRGIDKERNNIRTALLNTMTEMGFPVSTDHSLRDTIKECLSTSQVYSLKLNIEERKKRSKLHDENITNLLSYSRSAYESTIASDPLKPEAASLSDPFAFLQGRQAILKAAISLINKASHSEKPGEILLTFQGDYDIPEKSELHKEWSRAFTSALRKGWNIRHLIRLNRNMNRSFRIIHRIFNWMGHSGKYEPYYFSKYGSSTPANELIIVKNVGALICYNTGDSEYVDMAIYVHQKDALDALIRYFEKLALHTEPIIKLLNMDEYFYQTTVKDKTPGDHYLSFNDLHTLTYPYSIWCKYLQRTLSDPAEIERHAGQIKSRLEAFYDQIERYKYRIICPAKAIEYLVKSNRYYLQNKYQKPTKVDIIEHLKHLIKLLEAHSNFELALLDDNQKELLSPRNWEVKGENSVIMSLYSISDEEYEKNPIYFSISEGTIAGSFKDYYNELWERITPRCKDKSYVIAWLKQQMTELLRNHG